MRSTALLAACTAAIALLCLPFAVRQSGSGGPAGLAAAATVCLVCGVLSEGISVLLSRGGSPLAAMLFSMGVRMAPPLVVCLFLAAQGTNGREHLAFIVYLLVFYCATLAVETWLAVSRATEASSGPNEETR